MEKNKIIILKKNNSDVFFKYIDNRPIENYYKSSETNYLFKLFRKLKLPLLNLFLGKWTKNVEQYEKIIMFDNGFNEMVAKYIKNKNPKAKTILWYWNPITEYSKEFLKSKYIDEFWSYNKNDVEKYNINYNTQFYSKNVGINKNQIEYDISFLGNAKERKKDIIKIEKILNEKNIGTNFKIIENKNDYIRYDEYLEILSKSKCILDYNTNHQSPLTLRPLEALFLNKKLITNNKEIENYDFYNPNNIFILEKDNINNIKQFLESPYKSINKEIINYYDFKQWIERFGV